jgi:hypothetical protein
MATHDKGAEEPPLTEPVTVQCLYVTGIAIEVSRQVARLIGWVSLPDLGGQTTERRIVVRLAMALTTLEEHAAIVTTMVRE